MPNNNIYVCSYNTIGIICTKANTAFNKEGVFYVDGGWETIITKLRDIANHVGVQFWLKACFGNRALRRKTKNILF